MKLLFGLLTLALCLALPRESFAATETDPQQVVAVVNGEKITLGTIEEEISRQPILAYQKMLAKDDSKKLKLVQSASLHSIIDRKLLLDASKKSGFVDEDAVKLAVEQDLKNYGSKEQLVDMLKQIGTTYDRFVADIGDSHRIRTYLDKSALKDIQVSDDEAKAEFDKSSSKYAQKESVRARHILVKVDEKASAEEIKAAESKAEELRKQVSAKDGDFGTVAAAKSDCPSKARGGDLGYFSAGMMVPEFEKAAMALKPGEISPVVRTKFGFHVIKLEDRKAAGNANFAQVKDQVRQEVFARKRTEVIKQVIINLRKEATIDMKVNLEA